VVDKLVAFKVEGSKNDYNVWQFTPRTECVLWCVRVESEQEAIKLAKDKLAQKEA
jgi:hypothetical protein